MAKAKAKAKKKSTKSLAVEAPAGREASVSIRKISNGYIVTESNYGAGGKYKSKDTFSAADRNGRR